MPAIKQADDEPTRLITDARRHYQSVSIPPKLLRLNKINAVLGLTDRTVGRIKLKHG